MRRLWVDSRTQECVSAFDAAGIRSILLKGPSIARWLYDDGAGRTYGDSDLLVEPAQFEAAEGVLASLGFERIVSGEQLGEAIHAHTWKRPGHGGAADLHRRLPGANADPALVWAQLWARTETLSIGSVECRVLDRDGLALHVAIHAAFHGAGEQRPLEDLRRALERLTEDDWRRAADLANELGATAAFATGLRLDTRGATVAAALDLPTDAPVDLRLRATTPPPTALGVARVAATPGLGAKLALLARKAFPSPVVLRSWRPLARRGRAGLLAAYVLRPFWLLAHFPAALRAWRQASRQQ